MKESRSIFVDASAWIEAINPNAPEHALFREALLAEERLITSNFVLDEVLTHFIRRLGIDVASAVALLFLEEDVELVRVSPKDELEALAGFVSQPAPRPREGVSYTDFTCFALMRRLGIRRALAKDPHFEDRGFEVVPPRG